MDAEQYRPGPADWRARWLERVAEYRARLDVADNYGKPCARRVHGLAVHAAECAGFWEGWVAAESARSAAGSVGLSMPPCGSRLRTCLRTWPAPGALLLSGKGLGIA